MKNSKLFVARTAVLFAAALAFSVHDLSAEDPPNPSDDFTFEADEDNESLVIAGYTGRSTTVVIAAEYEGLPVRAIGESAFEEAGITAITLPNGVTFIGERAFEGCESLTSITLPNSVTSIGYGAFEGCGSLTSIALPNGVTDIGERAFRDCGSLETVTISPAKGRIWRGGAFGACPKLSPASKAALRAAGYKYNL